MVINASLLFESDEANSTTDPMTFAPSIKAISCERHVISSLLLLNVVVLATYLYGVYVFVRGETDYLFGLASHVSVCVCARVCVYVSVCVFMCMSLCLKGLPV